MSLRFDKNATPKKRREYYSVNAGDPDFLSCPDPLQAYMRHADKSIENALGIAGIPLGVATGFIIDGKKYEIPLATEEPSVIAAASFSATIIGRHGGFTTTAPTPLMLGQIIISESSDQLVAKLLSLHADLCATANVALASMQNRGGGLTHATISRIPHTTSVKITLAINVQDCMGANAVNACCEHVGNWLRETLGINPLLMILSNNAHMRRATARFSIPVSALPTKRTLFTSSEIAERIVAAGLIAFHDPDRAITHNKGIMNGVSALALATANDTRALEAAAHFFAASSGQYRSLTQYSIVDTMLIGSIDIPTPFAVVGGSTNTDPTAQFSLKLLSNPTGPRLGAIAAAVGLAQNFAALRALCSEGITHGHMRLHAKKKTSKSS